MAEERLIRAPMAGTVVEVGEIDDVIDPAQTRERLVGSLGMFAGSR